MKRINTSLMTSIVMLAVLLLSAGGVQAEETAVDRALKACQPEIEAYCSQVTPGEGRLLACFMAHEDKISGECGWALYQGMAELEAFVTAVAYVAEACWDDLVEYCGEVEMGEGRVATCLLENKEKVAPECKKAMEDTELQVVE
jgi:hypothetical protein